MFTVQFFCFATDAWETFEFSDIGKYIQDRKDAEKKLRGLMETYNPARMTGFHPDLVRIQEVSP